MERAVAEVARWLATESAHREPVKWSVRAADEPDERLKHELKSCWLI